VSTLTNVVIGLRSVILDSAPDECLWALDRDALRDRAQTPPPLTRPLTALQKAASEHHEAGHAGAAFKFGATSISVRSRDDGTGVCVCDKIENPLDAIVFHLAGPIAEARYNPGSIHKYTSGKSYDFMAARLLIDEINTRAKWQVMTCQRAAETAVEFVREHWRQIGNLALALGDAGEIDDHWIRIFATCGGELA
jgi:hypothetical protein